jgi:hypothetical protein
MVFGLIGLSSALVVVSCVLVMVSGILQRKAHVTLVTALRDQENLNLRIAAETRGPSESAEEYLRRMEEGL